MNILINDTRKIAGIREEFNTVFPYLKLEFCSGSRENACPTAKALIRPTGGTLAAYRGLPVAGEIIIRPEMSVTALENCFRDVYGLTVRIFRKSGKVWLETTVTDSWTLEEQNSQGEALSRESENKTAGESSSLF